MSTVNDSRTFAATTVGLGAIAFVHAFLTWPLDQTLVLFGVGALVAFLAEAVVIHRGWLDHHVGPRALGVPLYVLAGWTAVIYVAVRLALLVADGWLAVAIAATLATSYDVLADNYGVEAGHWTYTDDLPGPRHGEVPWWNYAGWFAISAITAAVTLFVL